MSAVDAAFGVATLNQGDNWRLVLHISSTATMYFASQIGFVSFHGSCEFPGGKEVHESETDAMAKEERSSVRSQFELSLKL
jgi:hypothetical protein